MAGGGGNFDTHDLDELELQTWHQADLDVLPQRDANTSFPGILSIQPHLPKIWDTVVYLRYEVGFTNECDVDLVLIEEAAQLDNFSLERAS